MQTTLRNHTLIISTAIIVVTMNTIKTVTAHSGTALPNAPDSTFGLFMTAKALRIISVSKSMVDPLMNSIETYNTVFRAWLLESFPTVRKSSLNVNSATYVVNHDLRAITLKHNIIVCKVAVIHLNVTHSHATIG